MFKLITEVPSVIAEFFHEVVTSEPTGNTVAEAFTYLDEKGNEQSVEVMVPEYADVTTVGQVTRPECKSKADLERVIALGKPLAVLEKFTAMVAIGDQWTFFDDYMKYLSDLALAEEFNADLPVIYTDEEGVETFAELRELPIEPVKPISVDALSASWSERRAKAYPSLADFADAFVKNQEGDSSGMVKYVADCVKVKLDIPKY